MILKEIFAKLLLENHLAVGELFSKLKKDTIYLKNQQSRNPSIFNPNQPLTSKFVIFVAYYSELFKKYMFNCD